MKETKLTAIQQKALTIKDFINSPAIVKQLEAALPKFLTAERFLRTFYTALLRTPKLLDCTKESLLSAMIQSAQLGLEPVLGKAALIPYGDEVQFQPMYRGLIDLARRTGNIVITGHIVYENDNFDISYGTDEKCIHKPLLKGERGEMIGAYTVWTFESGMQSFLFLPEEDILKVREKSQAWQYAKKNPKNAKAQECPWITYPEEMYIKTVIKRHSKLQSCSIEMERAIELDNKAETGESQLGLLDNLTNTPALPEEIDIEKSFKEQIVKKARIKEKGVNEFIEQLAVHYEKTTEEIKEEALKDVDQFIAGLKKFKADNEKEKTSTESPPDIPETVAEEKPGTSGKTITCPETDNEVPAKDCPDCNKREGCPAWAFEDIEEV